MLAPAEPVPPPCFYFQKFIFLALTFPAPPAYNLITSIPPGARGPRQYIDATVGFIFLKGGTTAWRILP
ncbi:hypothetical protein DPQ25_09770 [Hydrogeniiclostridium mannosilyticum]|uniref:Uncharacterized protein n=1 Tax=Hydrogeniiclostridium mannosilyticum TaxID=2764322 RepID=A0A328UF65_9FIRM|nr:hypothetical protein DPQ25_09770 [Hydrogeniiclostridium mannosilyticum]